MSTHHGGSRPQLYNDIGQQGRTTGIRAPNNVARDSGGNERASDFFNRDEFELDASRSQTSQPRRSPSRQARASSQSNLGSSQVNGRARERPDRYNEVGERGRKTGISAPRISVDADGYQNPDAFFASPQSRAGGHGPTTSSPRTAASNRKSRQASSSTAKKDGRAQPVALDRYDEYDDDAPGYGGDYRDGAEQDEYGASADMDIDDGSSLTPTAYQKSHGSTSRRGHSSLRNSTTAGSPQSRKSINGRHQSNYSDDQQEEEDAEDEEEGEGDSDSDDEVRRNVAPHTSSAKKHGLVQLGKNGQPVRQDKGKGKAVQRSPSPEREYGGGGSDAGEEYDNFDTYGDGGGAGFASDDSGDRQQQPQYDDQGEEEDEEQDATPVRKGKGKGRRSSDGDNTPNTPGSATKRQQAAKSKSNQSKKKDASSNQPKVIRAAPQKRQRDEDDEGKRRSNRNRIAPLEYWRGEKVIYKRRASGMGIKEVVMIPKEDPEPLAARRKGGAHRRAASQRVKSEVPEEEGVDSMTDPDGIVYSWEGHAEVSRRIAFTEKMMEPKKSGGNNFLFQKIFSELDYLAGGIIVIPVGSEKPKKASKDNSYIFYCIEGSVSVTIHRTRFAIGPGATFMVPRGNQYQITATSNRDVKLFFTQSRRVTELPDGEARADREEDYLNGNGAQGYEHGAIPEAEEEEQGEEEDQDEEEEQDEDEEEEE